MPSFRTRIQELEFPMQPVGSSSEMVFGFLEDGETMVPASFSNVAAMSSPASETLEEEDDPEKENNGGVEDNTSFWETQHQVLQATLCRSSSLESKIRNATKEALKDIKNMAGNICACGTSVAAGGCRSCLMREVSSRLSSAGYNSAICKSKWRSSPDIPSGEHTFIDVIDNSSTKKGEVRVIIELNFRAEFEMARASEDYNRLVRRLPEVFVGKVERLNNVIKILCKAAKKCMKEKKMHMGPWRKQRYMQAKWLSSYKRTTTSPVITMENSGRLPKPRASMLTEDLLDKLPNMHCTAVEVL
ncbi:hypothetical protein Pint_10560 [Pistacia integerrima]|uniref:Uncharacterized protein n=1 Tax=Pistacia integerrima TaxID=434235 RepID=A0ACC0XI93_9ROSI|nr:hypothetical protein Pint_10560 [Pistacia integerrima]